MNSRQPRVGLGVIIEDNEGLVLVMKREGSHAPYWSIPGGKLEPGETFEAGAARELKEELGIDAQDLKVIAVTNNLKTYEIEGVHFISIVLTTKVFIGKPRIMEHTKCSALKWVDPHNLPQPHFDASELGVRCYLKKVVYINEPE